jgi:hypothetical protein
MYQPESIGKFQLAHTQLNILNGLNMIQVDEHFERCRESAHVCASSTVLSDKRLPYVKG